MISQYYIASYDITENTTRNKLIKVLRKYKARRIQKSVFVVSMTYKQLDKIKTEVSSNVNLDPVTDHFMLINIKQNNAHHFQKGHDCDVNSYFGKKEILFI